MSSALSSKFCRPAIERPFRSISTGSAPTLFEYDTLGEQRREGLDVDGSGALGKSSIDRITRPLLGEASPPSE
jgi:hypothetical protein